MTTISAIGDSQFGGSTEMARPSLPDALREKGWTPLRYHFRNGGSTSVLIGELDQVLTPVPDAMLVMAGGNDNTRSSTAWGDMLSRLRAAGVRRVIWVGPPGSPDSAVDAERRAISELQRAFFASKPEVTWISGRNLASGLPRRDDVHLTAAGYTTYVSRIVSALDGTTAKGAMTLVLAGGVLVGAWWLANRAADQPARRRPRRRR